MQLLTSVFGGLKMVMKLQAQMPAGKILTEAVGDITYNDYKRYVKRRIARGGAAHSELLDARKARLMFSVDEVRLLANQILQFSTESKLGKTAIVIRDPASFGSLRMLSILTDGFYELGVFREKREAEKWLNWTD